MKQIMVSLSALRPSQFRKFVKGWDKGRYAEAFEKFSGTKDRNAYRIYLQLNRPKEPPLPAPSDIAKAVEEAGYQVEDYRAGIAVDKDGKRKMRIGRLLEKHRDLQKKFNEDKSRSAHRGKFIVCISRHPYDIAGSSTDRGWTSCMNLVDGSNKEYVFKDVKLGGLVAYLIDEKDLNIKNPTARLLIKPFVPKFLSSDGPVLVADGVYGTDVKGFQRTVQTWLDTYLNHKKGSGLYELHPDAYDDDKSSHVHMDSSNAEEVESFLGFKIVDGELQYNRRGVARRKVLQEKPEVLKLMKKATLDDIDEVSIVDARLALDFMLNRSDDVYDDDGNVAKKSNELAYNQQLRALVERDASLFKIVDKEIGITDYQIREMIRYQVPHALDYIPEARINDDIFDYIMNKANSETRATFIAKYSHRVPTDPKELLTRFPKTFLDLKKPTVEQFNTVTSLDDIDPTLITAILNMDIGKISAELGRAMLDYAIETRGAASASRFTHRITKPSSNSVLKGDLEFIKSFFLSYKNSPSSFRFYLDNEFQNAEMYKLLPEADRVELIELDIVDQVIGTMIGDAYTKDEAKLTAGEAVAAMKKNPIGLAFLNSREAVVLLEVSKEAFYIGMEHIFEKGIDLVIETFGRDCFLMDSRFWKEHYDLTGDASVFARAVRESKNNVLSFDVHPGSFVAEKYWPLLMAYTAKPEALAYEALIKERVDVLPDALMDSVLEYKMEGEDPNSNKALAVLHLQRLIAETRAAKKGKAKIGVNL